jgi:hypothetical protein
MPVHWSFSSLIPEINPSNLFKVPNKLWTPGVTSRDSLEDEDQVFSDSFEDKDQVSQVHDDQVSPPRDPACVKQEIVSIGVFSKRNRFSNFPHPILVIRKPPVIIKMFYFQDVLRLSARCLIFQKDVLSFQNINVLKFQKMFYFQEHLFEK